MTERVRDDRRATIRPGDPGRRALDRIRAFDPTILQCGPGCVHHQRHTGEDHEANVRALADLIARA